VTSNDLEKARVAARRCLRKHAPDVPAEDQEELASDAQLKLMEKSRSLAIEDPDAFIVTLVKGLLANWRKHIARERSASQELARERSAAEESVGSNAEGLAIGDEERQDARTHPRARRFHRADEDLWLEVRATCRHEFERRLGVPFPWDDAAALRFGQRTYLENEVRGVLARIRDAVVDGRALLARGRAASIGVLESVIGRLEGLDALPLGSVAEGRTALIRDLDTYNVLGLPPNDDGSSRMLDPREYALVSLLCGNRPELKKPPRPDGWTVAEVIAAERMAVVHAIQRHGVAWAADRRGTHTTTDARCMGADGSAADTEGEEDIEHVDEAPSSPGGRGGDPS
jgi:hypothetical protein